MASLVASVQHGRTVNFTGDSGGKAFFGGIQIDFGDGATDFFCRPGSACKDATATHAYAKPGQYTVRLLGQGEGQQTVVATATLTID
jgi:PKD repeat protein